MFNGYVYKVDCTSGISKYSGKLDGKKITWKYIE